MNVTFLNYQYFTFDFHFHDNFAGFALALINIGIFQVITYVVENAYQ